MIRISGKNIRLMTAEAKTRISAREKNLLARSSLNCLILIVTREVDETMKKEENKIFRFSNAICGDKQRYIKNKDVTNENARTCLWVLNTNNNIYITDSKGKAMLYLKISTDNGARSTIRVPII